MNNVHFLVTATVVAAAAVMASLAVWAASFLRYAVEPPYLKINWLGLTLRRIRLDDIKGISTRPVWFAERWRNTFHSADRRLVIRRRTGWCRNFVITPRHRYMFRAEMLNARDGLNPLESAGFAAGERTVLLDQGAFNPAENSPSRPAKNAA